MRQTTEWVESINGSGSDYHVYDQAETPHHDQRHGGPQRQHPNSQVNETPEPVRPNNKDTKPHDRMPLGPWNRRLESSQKVGTSTGFQSVNAHGFLPPFDGAGDARPSSTGSANTGPPRTPDQNHTPSKPAEPPRKWYMKPERQMPSSYEVWYFFRSVEEEERDMIEKYRIRHPTG